MQLTKGFEQAVCILVFLSTQDSQAPLTSDAINIHLQVSPSYLKKIMRKLVVNNLICSVPGNNGGFFLARSPEKIRLLDIVEAMEGKISAYPNSGLIKSTFQNILSTAAIRGEEVLTDVFKEADRLWCEHLSKQTVADLLRKTLEIHELPYTNWNLLNQEFNYKRGDE